MLGHYRYFGVSENSRGISAYRYLVKRLAFKWINRCSQRKSMNWLEFEKYSKRHGFLPPRIYVNLYAAPLEIEGISF
jgi:RNA-directed DNA polymerase